MFLNLNLSRNSELADVYLLLIKKSGEILKKIFLKFAFFNLLPRPLFNESS